MSVTPSGNEDLTWRGSRRCTATNRQTGERCLKAAINGLRVCATHGANAAASMRKGRLRFAELVDPAIAVMARIMSDPTARTSDRLRAAENVLDRAGIVRRSELDPDVAREILAERLAQMLAEQQIGDVIEGEVEPPPSALAG